MVETGFLSLNVHEALHFDGTPLCLHPDLLHSARNNGARTGGNVGDWLEIRVWDPRVPPGISGGNSIAASSNVASILRPRDASYHNNHTIPSVANSSSAASSTADAVRAVAKSEVIDAAASSLAAPEEVMCGATTTNLKGASLAKPPMQRRVTAPLPSDTRSSRPSKASSTTATKTTTTTSSMHVRDLSEMTVDSLSPSVDSSDGLLLLGGGGGDIIIDGDAADDTHQLRLSFYMVVTDSTWTSLKGSARTQVSLLRAVADVYQLSAYDIISIHTPDDAEAVARAVAIDFLLVTIKDQFISRGDMHYFQQCLLGSWVYQGQRLYEATRGCSAKAREIRRRDALALSGMITDKTVITFRSRSTRIIWLVQMSAEMWDYGPYDREKAGRVCEIYFDRWIAFTHKLFTKWKELEASHSLTVIFFDRTSLGTGPQPTSTGGGRLRDVYGRFYEDHFRIVLENETCPDWHSLIFQIKQAFVRYPLEVRWTLTQDETARRPSMASHGNVLEAINVTLNLLQFHYLDRDLQRTGNSIVIVSAGNGVFEVDRNLAGITYQVSRILSYIGRQICLGLLLTRILFLSAHDGQWYWIVSVAILL